PDLVHKSDVGAVRLGLSDPKTVHRAASELLSLVPGCHSAGAAAGNGNRGGRGRNPGPAVRTGRDGRPGRHTGRSAWQRGLRTPPLGAAEARRLLARLRGFPALAGARGRQLVDLDALAGIVNAV